MTSTVTLPPDSILLAVVKDRWWLQCSGKLFEWWAGGSVREEGLSEVRARHHVGQYQWTLSYSCIDKCKTRGFMEIMWFLVDIYWYMFVLDKYIKF